MSIASLVFCQLALTPHCKSLYILHPFCLEHLLLLPQVNKMYEIIQAFIPESTLLQA